MAERHPSEGPVGGHTDGKQPMVSMEFVNFDGRITGEAARALIRAAKIQGRTPQDLLQSTLRYSLGELLDGDAKADDVKVEPMTINAGNGGFHIMTFVADGYGNLVAEDNSGKELARAVWEDTDEGGTHDIFRRLADEVISKSEAPSTD